MRTVLITLIGLMVLVACADENPVGSEPETTVVIAAPAEIAFPQFKEPAEASMQALLQGTLLIEDGCLRVGDATQSYLVLWPAGFTVATNSAGDIVVRDGLGNNVAQVDQPILLDGGEVRLIDETLLQAPLPDCAGPYWVAGSAISMP